MAEYDDVMRVLMANANKSFVRRILQPQAYPTLDLGNGQKATHMMSWAEADGKYYVYPRILYDGKALKDYGDAAFDQAMKSGNVIEFKTPQEADWFSRRYKVVWGE